MKTDLTQCLKCNHFWYGTKESECPKCSETAVLTGAEVDTLVALVEAGPLEDGDVPSKCGRDSLVRLGLAARIVVKGEDGYTAATDSGCTAYKARYDNADTIRDATAMRKAMRVLNSVSANSRH